MAIYGEYGGLWRQQVVNTLTVLDASYLRLKNARISYNIPTVNSKFFKQIQVYVTGQNLYTITEYIGFDPEANANGRSNARVDKSGYPLARTWMLGAKVQF
jgi:hypothetical protein